MCTALKETNGVDMISDTPGKLNRWREHFEQAIDVTRDVDPAVCWPRSLHLQSPKENIASHEEF